MHKRAGFAVFSRHDFKTRSLFDACDDAVVESPRGVIAGDGQRVGHDSTQGRKSSVFAP